MKTLWFLPLTFLAGAHGFAIFAPYVAVVMASVMLFRPRPRPAPIPIHAGIQPPVGGV